LLPAKASEIVNKIYIAAGKNELYARQGRASTNDLNAEVHSLFDADTNLMGYFNRAFAGGKWDHFMDQPVLGYTSWNQPQNNNLNAIRLDTLAIVDSASMGIAVDGSSESWPGSGTEAMLPEFDSFNRQSSYIDVFNRGKTEFSYSTRSDKPWIKISSAKGEVEKQCRIWIYVDWNRIHVESDSGTVEVTGAGRDVKVKVVVFNSRNSLHNRLQGFVEGDGFVSIEAEHYSKRIDEGTNRWINIQDYGQTSSAMSTTSGVNAQINMPGKGAPCLEYKMFLLDSGKVDVEGVYGPILNFAPDRGVRCAVSFDGGEPEIVTLIPQNYNAQNGNRDWEKSVVDNVRYSHTSFTMTRPGYHTLKMWMVDPGVVLEKIIVNCGGLRPSYLGPPESFHGAVSNGQ